MKRIVIHWASEIPSGNLKDVCSYLQTFLPVSDFSWTKTYNAEIRDFERLDSWKDIVSFVERFTISLYSLTILHSYGPRTCKSKSNSSLQWVKLIVTRLGNLHCIICLISSPSLANLGSKYMLVTGSWFVLGQASYTWVWGSNQGSLPILLKWDGKMYDSLFFTTHGVKGCPHVLSNIGTCLSGFATCLMCHLP